MAAPGYGGAPREAGVRAASGLSGRSIRYPHGRADAGARLARCVLQPDPSRQIGTRTGAAQLRAMAANEARRIALGDFSTRSLMQKPALRRFLHLHLRATCATGCA